MNSTRHCLYGIHSVSSRLEKSPETITQLYLQENRRDKRIQAIADLAYHAGIEVQLLTSDELTVLADSSQHQGVVADCIAEPEKIYDESSLLQLIEDANSPTLFLILDGVQDPHNLGACLRSADAAGVTAVIAPKDKAATLTATVRKVACGAAEHVPFIQVTNLARTLSQLQQQGVWLYGLAGEATASIYETDLTGPIALVMGAEGKGLRRLTREHCDHLLQIPMHGTVSSLNVSVATGICLFEVRRQRAQCTSVLR